MTVDRRTFVAWAGAALALLRVGRKAARPAAPRLIEGEWMDIDNTAVTRLTVPTHLTWTTTEGRILATGQWMQRTGDGPWVAVGDPFGVRG